MAEAAPASLDRARTAEGTHPSSLLVSLQNRLSKPAANSTPGVREQTPLEFVVKYTPVFRGAKGSTEQFQMVGDQWSIGGDVLKWHPWVNLLGLKNAHKLTRLSSRYLKAEAEMRQPRSAYDLNGGSDSLWRCLHRFGAWLPFVEAVYGNTAYAFARPGSQWGVYVTLSGYLIKPLRAPPGQRG